MMRLAWVGFFALAASAAPALSQTYGIGTSPLGTITYSAGSAIATVATQKTGLQLRVQPYGGTTQAMPVINSGEVNFGLCNILEAQEAFTGTGVFHGHQNRDIRLVAVIFPLHAGLFARADSGIRTVKDLKGRAVTAGYTSQAIIRTLQDAVLATAGLTDKDIKAVPVPNIVRGADDFESGKADAFFFAVGAARVQQAGASVNGVRLVAIDNTPQALAALRRSAPLAYISVAQPGPHAASVPEPTPVLTYDYMFIASAHTPDDVVYKVVKALHGDKQDLAASFAAFRDFDPDHMAKSFPVPFHPGALKFYREISQSPDKG